MARVPAYHSSNYDDPHVHHIFDDCPPGSQIPRWNRVEGTGNYRLCQVCESMR